MSQIRHRKQKGQSMIGLSACSAGAPGAIRTPDPLVRSQVLYPAELRAHCQSGALYGCSRRMQGSSGKAGHEYNFNQNAEVSRMLEKLRFVRQRQRLYSRTSGQTWRSHRTRRQYPDAGNRQSSAGYSQPLRRSGCGNSRYRGRYS